MKKPSLTEAFKNSSTMQNQAAEQPVEKAQKGQQANRLGKQSINAYIEPLAVRELKLLALNEGKTQQELFREAINDLFLKYGMKPLA